jgi:hypothetical protein
MVPMKASAASKINASLLAGLLWCCPLLAHAGHEFESGLTYFHFDYVEDCPPPLKSTEEDWILGSYAAYSYFGDTHPLLGRLRFDFARAATDYDGTDQKGNPLRGKTANTLITGEVNLGFQFLNWSRKSLHLASYTGFGFKYRDRDLGLYSEEYTWKYIPLGLLLEKQLGARWLLAIDASLRFMFDGEIKVNLSEYRKGMNDPRADLGSKTGFRVATPILFKVQPEWAIALTPWYEYSALGRCEPFPITLNGEVIGAAYEPDSETRQYGADLGVRVFF